MPRPTLIIRPRKLTIALPEDVAARLELYLTSPAEQRVPHGAYQRFFVERIGEFFAKWEADGTTVAATIPTEGDTLLAELTKESQ
jgi:hypothetical protein